MNNISQFPERFSVSLFSYGIECVMTDEIRNDMVRNTKQEQHKRNKLYNKKNM